MIHSRSREKKKEEEEQSSPRHGNNRGRGPRKGGLGRSCSGFRRFLKADPTWS